MSNQIAPKDHMAFPCVFDDEKAGVRSVHLGMELRDWFAGQAMVGWLSYNGEYVDMTSDAQGEKVAAWSYAYADAMLKERAK